MAVALLRRGCLHCRLGGANIGSTRTVSWPHLTISHFVTATPTTDGASDRNNRESSSDNYRRKTNNQTDNGSLKGKLPPTPPAERGEQPQKRQQPRPSAGAYWLSKQIKSCGSNWRRAIRLLEQLKRSDDGGNVYAYTSAISCCARAGGRSVEAIKLLEDMVSEGIEPTAQTFSSAIHACIDSGEAATVLKLLEDMRRRGMEPNDHTYNHAVLACSRGNDWGSALELFYEARQRMKSSKRGILWASAGAEDETGSGDERSYPFNSTGTINNIMGACARAGQWEKALELLDLLRKDSEASGGNRPLEISSFNTAISACGKGGQWRQAIALLDECVQMDAGEKSSTPDDDRMEAPPRNLYVERLTYNLAIGACQQSGQWKLALGLLDKMRQSGDARLRPDVVSYSKAISACEKGARWEEALSLLREMIEASEVESSSRATALNAADKSRPDTSVQRNVSPNVVTVSSAMSACEKGGRWEHCLALLEEMPRLGIEPNQHTFSAAMRACVRGGQWEKAIDLVHEINRRAKEAADAAKKAAEDAAAASAGAAAETAAGTTAVALARAPPSKAEGLKKKAAALAAAIEQDKPGLRANVNMAIEACEAAGKIEPAMQIMVDAQRMYGLYDACFATPTDVDLHGLSVPAARVAVRCALAQLLVPKSSRNPLPRGAAGLTVITGRGRHTQGGTKAAVLPSEVRSFLANIKGPAVTELGFSKPGCFLLTAADIEAWRRRILTGGMLAPSGRLKGRPGGAEEASHASREDGGDEDQRLLWAAEQELAELQPKTPPLTQIVASLGMGAAWVYDFRRDPPAASPPLWPLLVTCEHASEGIPPGYGPLESALEGTHWAYDPGALSFAEELASACHATLVAATFSRLLIDPNRPLTSDTLIRAECGDTKVAMNAPNILTTEEIRRRISTFYVPFQLSIGAAKAAVDPQLILSVHSFNKTYQRTSGGVPEERNFEVGVLCTFDDALAEQFCDAFNTAGFRARMNEPYSGKEGIMFSVEAASSPSIISPDRVPCIMFEFRNDVCLSRSWRKRALDVITAVVANFFLEKDLKEK